LEPPEPNSELPISFVLKQRHQNYIGMPCGMPIRTRRLLPTFSRAGLRALSNRLGLEIGPILDALPDFPLPMGALAPLRAKAEQQGNSDFTPFWSGQSSPLGREMPARQLTLKLVQEAVDRLKQLSVG
jgi:hypothetical protein